MNVTLFLAFQKTCVKKQRGISPLKTAMNKQYMRCKIKHNVQYKKSLKEVSHGMHDIMHSSCFVLKKRK